MGKITFLKEFFSKTKMVGSITPSSRFLAKKMLRNLEIETYDLIVEFGPGTGVFTEAMQRRINPTTKIILIELNPIFCEEISKKLNNPQIEVIQGSALDLWEILSERGLSKADCVVSSLPLAFFPLTLRDKILKTAHGCLKNKGKFVQFQYSLQSKGAMKQIFSDVKVDYTALNFPPAFVYTCEK